MALLLIPYQEASSGDRTDVLKTLGGKVEIKLEPHGSVRAKVFDGQRLQYEFILDRESQQNLLTQSISKANIYLVGKGGEELVIDDLTTKKRYILSIFKKTGNIKNIPPAQTQPIIVKGYSTSLME
ncbi:hypothetical protein GCM10027085_44870 [Spirosoma aerophilum]